MLRASSVKDKDTQELCKSIMLVPKMVQYNCLHKYVEKCQEIYAIAFLQWRNLFPHPTTHSEREINNLIDAWYDKVVNNYETDKELSEETKEGGKLP